jgi:hypothetical protein
MRWTIFLVALVGVGMAQAAIWVVDPERATDATAGRFANLADLAAALPAGPAESLTVRLMPGTHRLGAPLEIDLKATRGFPLRFEGGGKAVVSGGQLLTNWRLADGRWEHPWDGPPVREMFSGEQRIPRARFPAEGWLRVAAALPDRRSGFTLADELPAVGPAAELLFLHDWSVTRVAVAAIEKGTLRTVGPIGFPASHFAIDHFEPHPRFCLENDPVFLKVPGTWCHDVENKRLLYLPRPGERPESLRPTLPSSAGLLVVNGSPEAPVTDLTFQGISFAHSRWAIPARGYAEGQATKHEPRDQSAGPGDPHQQWTFVPHAVTVQWGTRVVFEQCVFRNLGGSGLLLGAGCRDGLVRDCVVRDVSGNGIGLGEGAERKVDGPDGPRPWIHAAPEQVATGNRIENCLVEHCGAQFHGAVGIWSGITHGTRITGNTVRHLPYTGISIGWMWNPSHTPAAQNTLSGNHIHHVMQLLSDGGGIYTLGRQPGMVIRDNLIHDIPLNLGRAESNGMFLDEGSSEFTIAGNLIHGTAKSPLRFHKAGNLEVLENAWLLPPDNPALHFNNTPPENITASENRILTQGDLDAAIRDWHARHPAMPGS